MYILNLFYNLLSYLIK